MKGLKAALNTFDTISIWTGKITSFLVVGMVMVTVYEVVLRYVFNKPTIWAFETVYLILGAYAILGGAYTLYLKGHVNVDIVHGRFSTRGKAIADLATSVFFFIFTWALVTNMAKMALESIRIYQKLSSAWAPPLYHLKTLMLIGIILLLLQGLAKFIRDINTALTGRESL